MENVSSVPRILFLCTGNSCRSQMAEGWARHLHPGHLIAYSAGVKSSELNADAVWVMAEAGVDISNQRSKHIDELADIIFDCVVTVCDNAKEACPIFPNASAVIHHSFDDPPHLATNAQTQDARLQPYRRVRDEIRDFVLTLPETLKFGCTSKSGSQQGLLP